MERLAFLEKMKETQQEKYKRLEAELAMPFYKRIQIDHNVEQLKRVEETQRWAMEGVIKKHWVISKDDQKELFEEFFTEYLKGKVKNINDFLKNRGFKKKDK